MSAKTAYGDGQAYGGNTMRSPKSTMRPGSAFTAKNSTYGGTQSAYGLSARKTQRPGSALS